MDILFLESAWEDYLYWQQNDRQIVKKINTILKDTLNNPFQGIGKPEPLKFNMSGCWSRRINTEHRLVYKIENDSLIIIQCRYHY